MRISHKHRFVFIAYPRTGSTSISRVLDPYSDLGGGHKGEATPGTPFYDHITAAELVTIFNQRDWDWDGYCRFAVVRNPYERLVSLYLHRRRHDSAWDTRSSLAGNLTSLLLRSLPERTGFAFYVLTRSSNHGVAADFKTYTCDGEGRSLITDALRFEDFPEALTRFLNGLGLSLPSEGLPHLNRSGRHRAYRGYYSRILKHRVSKLYSYDIEQFGYSF